uniref:Malate dehydrogenase 1Ab, NAD (soluble) n=1 Tax=Gouania willdenowi TaxID=441366 RepID=A0A8C5HNT0_GOUWI
MRCGVPASHVKNVIIWGNHSSTQYPDVHHCKVNMSGSEVGCFEAVKDDAWLKGDFISTVQLRGAAVIKARKLSSAMSAAKPSGEFVSMGDLIYSFPVEIKNKTWKIVNDLPVNDFSRSKMDATAAELVDERDNRRHLPRRMTGQRCTRRSACNGALIITLCVCVCVRLLFILTPH